MDRNLPTFILIGPGRAGTTWLYEVLRSHPQVFMARGTKETFFFDREFHRGIEWYQKFFEGSAGASAIGEATNTYIYNPWVPQRIKSIIPDVRLLTCLRNPLERIQSVYFYRKRAGTLNCSFEDALDNHPDLLSDNLYWTLLSRFLDYFDQRQLFVFFFDDLQADSIRFVKNVYCAIGVDDEYIPNVVTQRVNVGAEARLAGTSQLFRFMADSMRLARLHVLLDALKRNVWLGNLAYRKLDNSERSILTPDLRQRLSEMYQPEIVHLAEFTGRDLSGWLHI